MYKKSESMANKKNVNNNELINNLIKEVKSKPELSKDEKHRILNDIKKGKYFDFHSGYSSIDRPWLKYYSEEQINENVPKISVYSYLYKQNKNHLDKIALNYYGKKISFKKLFKNIENTAKSLKSIGVKENEIVTILMPNTPEVVYLFYAMSKIGAICNMVDPRSSSDNIQKYIKEAKSNKVIIIDSYYYKIESLCNNKNLKKVIIISPGESLPIKLKFGYRIKKTIESKGNLLKKITYNEYTMNWEDFISNGKTYTKKTEVQYKSNKPLVIEHTGGTTGEPKGVVLSNENINAVVLQSILTGIDMKREHNWLNIMPTFIAYGIGMGLHLPLSIGMETILIAQFDPKKFDSLLIKYKPIHMVGVPSHWINIINSKKLAKKNLSYIIAPTVGGDKMDITLEIEANNFLKEHKCSSKIVKGYGMTEVAGGVSGTTDNSNEIGSVGIPFVKTTISIFEPNTENELPYNEDGEICITGPNMMLGYFNNKEETDKILKKHSDGKYWIHTGDIGHINENGSLYITDRIKRIIIRYDGFKIFPSIIERVICSHKNVETCKVVAIEDIINNHGKLPKAYVVLKKDYKNDYEDIEKQLKTLCLEKLSEYSQPYEYSFVDELPFTSTGKIDYLTLEKQNVSKIQKLKDSYLSDKELIKIKNKISKMTETEKNIENLKRRNISLGISEEKKTGYPSIDKPWLKYYTENQINFTMPNSTCYGVLYNNNKDHLEDIAINYFGNKISYKELFQNIEKSTKAYQKLGIKKGDIVSFLAIDTPEVIYSFYALNRLGAISNMVDPRSSVSALKKYFNEVNSEYVISLDVFHKMMLDSLNDTKIKNVIEISPINSASNIVKILTIFKRLPKACDKRFISWEDFIKIGDEVFKINDVEYEKNYPATIVHTGGTTGKPKGVVLSNDNLTAVVYQVINSPLPQNRQDKFLNVTVPFVAFGLALGTHLPLSLGWKSIFIPNFEISKMRRLMKKYKPQLIMGTQTYFEPMVFYKKFNYKNTKAMLMGGMPTNAEFEKRLNNTIKKYNGTFQVSKGYSMTEASAMGTCSFNNANELGSDGIPMPKTVISAFEPGTDHELPYNSIGEICIKTPTMMLGYYNNEEETNKIIQKHSEGEYWIHSGDLGYVTENGFIYIKDRMKRMIIYSGYKIFPAEIENSFVGHDEVEKCCVVAMDDPKNDKVPAAFISLINKDISEDEKESIKNELYKKMEQDGLPNYFKPKEIFIIDDFPITNAGKVDYKALEEKANSCIKNKKTKH